MTTLNSTQLSNLQDIQNITFSEFESEYATGNNIAATYYLTLVSDGVPYGSLALGVVRNDTPEGEVANAYSANVANNVGVDLSVGSTGWLAAQYNIMQADYNARGPEEGGSNGEDLSWDDYDTYHAEAFALTNPDLTANAWTMDVPLNIINNLDPDAATTAWNSYASGNMSYVQVAESGIGLALKAGEADNLETALGGDDNALAYAHWLNDAMGAFATMTSEQLAALGVPSWMQSLSTALSSFGSLTEETLGDWLDSITMAFSSYASRTLGPALPIFESLMSQSEKDPLVLDLTGDGVSLTTTDGSSEYFDISGSDVSNLTAWATGGDGILVTDPDNTGVISSVSQLIGGDTGNGFASLSTFDSNGDGQITSADTNWSELRVFVPAWDSNAGGLYTLSALGITSISLNAINTSYQISGNNITQSSTFTMGGDSYAIDDVWLNYSTVNTVYTGSYTLDPDVLFLPEVRGYGDLPDLSIAMSAANDNEVQSFGMLEMQFAT